MAGTVAFHLLLWCMLTSPYIATRNPFSDSDYKGQSPRVDQCFCELQGPVDECCCDVETVDNLNSGRIHPLITSLVKFPYFKFYQVNLNQPCPFWPDNGGCMMMSCDVEECEQSEVPVTLQLCDQQQEESLRLSFVNSTVSTEQREYFKKWEEYDDSEESFCQTDVDRIDELIYVDLLLNPERFTGYSGPPAHKIWNSIYQENCFRPEEQSVSTPFESSLIQGMCLEKRAFFRIISGMHASINIHLSALYKFPGESSEFEPNINEFFKRFDAANTNGQGPSWLKNLYFAYLLVLRAIAKLESYWTDHRFYTGDAEDDQSVNEKVMQIVQTARSCSVGLFDESMLFTSNTSQELKKSFRAHFKNITRIMDCVGCSKCRLWGKLQVHGIGTALKVLFSGKRPDTITLKRREIVALFNVLGRFSSSIHHLENFRNIKQRTANERTEL